MKHLLLIMSFLLWVGQIKTKAQWELLAPLDTVPANIYCKFFNDSTGIVCSGGNYYDLQIVKTWDYGEHWDTIYTSDGFYTDIDFVNEMTGYLCTYYGPVLKTIDGGYTWNNINEDQSLEFTFHNMYFLNENVGFSILYGGNGGVWQTVNGGLTWENIINSASGYNIFATSICDIYITDLYFFKSSNDCEPFWTNSAYYPEDVVLYDAKGIHMIDDQNGLVCGNWAIFQNGSFISRTSDGGQTWTPVVQNEFNSLYLAFEFINTTEGYCGGGSTQEHPYAVLKTSDGGMTWGYQEIEIFPEQINGFGNLAVGIYSISCPTGGDTCYAVGAYGGVWRTFNSGGPTHPMPVSVSENQNLNKTLNAFPNPTSTSFRIEATQANEVRAIEIYNATGQIVAQYATVPNEMDVRNWPSGCYNVVVKYDNEVVRTRVVVE